MSRLKESIKAWQETILAPALARFAERNADFKTASGLTLQRLYTPDDVEGDYEAQVGFPGQYPFTRGIQPTMYRGRLWTMRQ